MFELVWTPGFTRAARKFVNRHPGQKSRLAEVLRMLETDPASPSLRLHALHGKLAGLHAVSLTSRFRITLRIDAGQRELLLLDIGSHDQVYR